MCRGQAEMHALLGLLCAVYCQGYSAHSITPVVGTSESLDATGQEIPHVDSCLDARRACWLQTDVLVVACNSSLQYRC